MDAEKTKKTGISRHGLLMLLCCLVPIAIMGALWALGVSSSYLYFGVLLLCPLMMVIMTFGSHEKHENHGNY